MKLVKLKGYLEDNFIYLNPLNIRIVKPTNEIDKVVIEFHDCDNIVIKDNIEQVASQINEALNYTPQLKYQADKNEVLNPLSDYANKQRDK